MPGFLNDTYHIVNEDHRRLVLNSIPSSIEDGELAFDQCKVYTDYNVSLNNQYEYVGGCNMSAKGVCDSNSNSNSSRPTEACTRWVYDQSEMESTLITDVSMSGIWVVRQTGRRTNGQGRARLAGSQNMEGITRFTESSVVD